MYAWFYRETRHAYSRYKQWNLIRILYNIGDAIIQKIKTSNISIGFI